MNTDWIAGVIVVVGIALGCGSLLTYAIWDVVRLRRGENLSITASSWIAKFCARHSIVVFLFGFAVGALVAHFTWPVVLRVAS